MTPFLEAHRVFSRFYLLSPGPSPISIRDQMLRGRLIVEELNHEEIINKDKPLLVVGGGAGGVTAAMFAAQKSIPTTLVERKRACFSVQKLSSRFIHPNQYDWPVDHYIKENVLFDTLLPFEANKAEELAHRWEERLGMFAKTNDDYCTLMFNTEITNIQVISDTLGNDLSLRVTFNNAEVYNFSAVIWAIGAGSEDCQLTRKPGVADFEYDFYFLAIAKLLHDQYFRLLDFYFHTLIQQRRKPIYEGIKFWDKDQFVSERCGLTIDNTPRIVISGSGDGALQDFLRCVTRINSAIHIYNQLFDSILVTRRTNIEAVVQSAEDRARRCLIWASTREQEDCIYQELEDTHKYLISDLLDNDSNIYDNLGDLLEVWLNENAKISLVFRRNYFNNYYSLNRFLVLLIAQYLQDRYRHNHTVLYEKREISSITPEGHRCMRKNSQGTWMPTKEENGTRSCYGREHTVILKDVNDEITTDELTLTANIIIIRHGVNRDSIHSVLNQHKKRCSEIIKKQHLMPYHWPPTGLTVSLF